MRPQNIIEANELLVEYYNRLLTQGESQTSAYLAAMSAYRNKKKWFKGEVGEMIGCCKTCNNSVLYGEEYVVFMDGDIVVHQHWSCHEEERN
jgi:hypothetical protein